MDIKIADLTIVLAEYVDDGDARHDNTRSVYAHSFDVNLVAKELLHRWGDLVGIPELGPEKLRASEYLIFLRMAVAYRHLLAFELGLGS